MATLSKGRLLILPYPNWILRIALASSRRWQEAVCVATTDFG